MSKDRIFHCPSWNKKRLESYEDVLAFCRYLIFERHLILLPVYDLGLYSWLAKGPRYFCRADIADGNQLMLDALRCTAGLEEIVWDGEHYCDPEGCELFDAEEKLEELLLDGMNLYHAPSINYDDPLTGLRSRWEFFEPGGLLDREERRLREAAEERHGEAHLTLVETMRSNIAAAKARRRAERERDAGKEGDK